MEAGNWIGLGLFALIAIIAARAIFFRPKGRRRGDSGAGFSSTSDGPDSDGGGGDGGGGD